MNGKIIWVKRGELPNWYSTAESANTGNAVSRKIMQTRYKDVHESEWNWVGFPVDYIIDNNGTLDDLYEQVESIQQKIFKSQLNLV
jgi:hypothetical protein